MDTKLRLATICLLCVMVSVLLSSFSFGSAQDGIDTIPSSTPDDLVPVLLLDSSQSPASFSGRSVLFSSIYYDNPSSFTRQAIDLTSPSFYSPSTGYIYVYSPRISYVPSSHVIEINFSTPSQSAVYSRISLRTFSSNNFIFPTGSDISSDGVTCTVPVSSSYSGSSFVPSNLRYYVIGSSVPVDSDPTFPAPSPEQYGQARAIWEYYEGSKPSAYTLLYDIAINQGLALNTIADNSTEILKLLQNGVGSGSGSGSGSTPEFVLDYSGIWRPVLNNLSVDSAGGALRQIMVDTNDIMNDTYDTLISLKSLRSDVGFETSLSMSQPNIANPQSPVTTSVSSLASAFRVLSENQTFSYSADSSRWNILNDFVGRIETLYASDEDIAFQESQQATVDQVKDDFFGDDPAFSPSTSSDAKSAVNGVVSGFSGGTDITFGQAVAVMGDTSAWGQFFTQAVSDSLDTSESALISVVSDDDLSYIDDIPPDVIHVPSQPTFSDLYPDYVEGE